MPSNNDRELKLPGYMDGKGRTKAAPQPKPDRKPNTAQKTKHEERRQPQQRKPRKRVNYRRLITICALLVLIAVGSIAAVKHIGSDGGQLVIGQEQNLPDGVSILGINVGGKTKTEARNAVAKKAEEIIAASCVVLRCGREEYKLTGEDISLSCDVDAAIQRAMAYVPDDSGVVDVTVSGEPGQINDVFTWNGTTLRMKLEDIAGEFDQNAIEAQANPAQNGDGTISLSFVEGVPGRKLKVAENLEYIEKQFNAGSFEFDMDVKYEDILPSFTAADLQGDFGKRSEYTTEYAISTDNEVVQNRVFNIEKAAGFINGITVAAGEEWSFNGFIGPRTYETGWKGANGIADGKSYSIQAGGGICQVSTTLYNALLCGNITITERRSHSIPSSYVPKGLDATVDSITNKDLKFMNDTGGPIFIFAHTGEGSDSRHNTVTVEIYGKKLEEGVTYATRSKIVETIRRKNIHYTDDDTIPRGYKVVTVERRDGYKAEAYQDKYVNGVLEGSKLLYTDTYNGNDEEARRGTASPKYYKPPEDAVKID